MSLSTFFISLLHLAPTPVPVVPMPKMDDLIRPLREPDPLWVAVREHVRQSGTLPKLNTREIPVGDIADMSLIDSMASTNPEIED